MSSCTRLPDRELIEVLRSPLGVDAFGPPPAPAVVVDITDGSAPPDLNQILHRVRLLPYVLVGLGPPDTPIRTLFDVVIEPDAPGLADIAATVSANPRAAAALVVVLRGAEARSISDGLAVESAVYSTLQGGPEFEAWRAAHPIRIRRDETDATVRVTRDGNRLDVVLSRPHVHNAFNARMRDELLDALGIALADDSVREVVLAGDGPSFCSGGDLDEFGTFPDPATAHLVRLARSVGRVIASMSGRVVARLHGACMGSGIELPAFAGRVVAAPNTTIGLPELGMGLIPGAGGTASLTRRIGRHRTALLALTRTPIDASTALEWGLVDSIEDR